MKLIFSVLIFVPSAAVAHESVMPHVHPHGESILPDLYVTLAATTLVGAVLLLRHLLKRWTR
jgi:hypothetical protein